MDQGHFLFQADGKVILIAPQWSKSNIRSAPLIVRLQPDGGIDESFAPEDLPPARMMSPTLDANRSLLLATSIPGALGAPVIRF